MSSKVKVLRSTVAGKRPTGKEFGELWVNDKDKVMGYIDSAGQPVVPFALPSDIVIHKFDATVAYRPGDVVLGPDGELWSAKAAVVAGAWDATKWNHSGDSRFVNLTGDTMTGALNLPTGVPTGNNAVSRTEGDKLYVNLTGDTMTGALTLSGAPTADLHAATKKYADDKLTAAKTQADTDYVNVSGDTMTGALNLPADGLTVGTTQLVVKNGNVGIGVTPSAWASGVPAFDIGAMGAVYAGSTSSGLAYNAYAGSGGWSYKQAAVASKYEQNSGQHTWSTAPSGTAGNPITFKQAMTLDASGNLGLGMAPSAWWGGRRVLQIGGDNVGSAFIACSPGTADYLVLGTNTYTDATTAAKYLHDGQASTYTQRAGDHSWESAPTGTAGSPVTLTRIMHLNAVGDLSILGANATKASGTTWANPSDVRLKDNIQPFTKGLNELLKVDVKTWEYNGKGGTVAGTKGLGVIADEVMQVLPDTVDTYSAKLNPDDEEEIDIKRFDATEITWLLVNSIKEQQALITDLQTRLAALEAKP
jgi:hypothetical protein